MTKTKNLQLDLLQMGQGQKEVTINESLIRIDAMLNSGVVSRNFGKPPKNAKNGDVHIVSEKAKQNAGSDEWQAENVNQLAYFFDLTWHFIEPQNGAMIWVNDENAVVIYKNNQWEKLDLAEKFFTEDGKMHEAKTQSANVNEVAQDEQGDARVNLNKNSDTNFACTIYKSNHRGHAEFGLLGNNDFTLKISPNGQDFYESFKISHQTGEAFFEKRANFKELAKGLNVVEKINTPNEHSHIDIDGQKANIFEINLNSTATLKFLAYGDKLMQGQRISLIIQTNGHHVEILSKCAHLKNAKITEDGVYEFITSNGGKNWNLINGGQK